MSGTYKTVTLVGTSPVSIEVAIQGALRDASESLRSISWFEVREVRGSVHQGGVREYQVKLDAGFKVERG